MKHGTERGRFLPIRDSAQVFGDDQGQPGIELDRDRFRDSASLAYGLALGLRRHRRLLLLTERTVTPWLFVARVFSFSLLNLAENGPGIIVIPLARVEEQGPTVDVQVPCAAETILDELY